MSRSVDLENSAKTLTEGKKGAINVPDEMIQAGIRAVEARKEKEAKKAQLAKEAVDRKIEEASVKIAERDAKAREKREAQANLLKKTEAVLDKIEKKTDKLLSKAKPRKEAKKPPTTRKQAVNKTPTTPIQSKRDVSFLTLKMMPPRKTPRIILEHIRANSFMDNGEWFSTIDSYELSSLTGKSSDQNGTTIRRLRDQGWFDLVKADSGGFRLVRVNPENYGLKP